MSTKLNFYIKTVNFNKAQCVFRTAILLFFISFVALLKAQTALYLKKINNIIFKTFFLIYYFPFSSIKALAIGISAGASFQFNRSLTFTHSS
ncbi:Uncharacterised protein [Sphingobacterium multivorum]|nr:Uncharacterised protein [Sphingobacterium multivorum]